MRNLANILLLLLVASLAFAGDLIRTEGGNAGGVLIQFGATDENTLTDLEDRSLVLDSGTTGHVACNASFTTNCYRAIHALPVMGTKVVRSFQCQLGDMAGTWDSGDRLDACVYAVEPREDAGDGRELGCISLVDLDPSSNEDFQAYKVTINEVLTSTENGILMAFINSVDTGTANAIEIGCNAWVTGS